LQQRLAHRNERTGSVPMVINSLVALSARCKCAHVALGRFSSLRCASSGRAEMSHVPRATCSESSHNTSSLKRTKIWPLEWSSPIARHASAAALLRGEAEPFGPRLAPAAVSKRARQQAGGRGAADSRRPRGLAETVIEALRGRARATTTHDDGGEHRRAGARAAARARHTCEATPRRRVPALRLGVAGDVERMLSALREGARCP
jgi:hypothetical protein